MSRTRKPARSASGWVACALALGGFGCGAGEPGPEGEAVSRTLALAPVSAPRAREAARVVASLRVPEGLAPWEVVAARSEVAPPPDGGGPPALYLHGRAAKSVMLPGPFATDAFDQVAVTLRIRTHTLVHVALWREGELVELSAPLRVWSTQASQRVLARFPRLRLEAAPIDAIAVELPAEVGPVVIEEVELIAQPLASWLPAAGSAPALLSVGDDQRRATVIDDATPLEARFTARAGEALAFSCALPDEPRFPAQAPRLRVRLTAGIELREHELDVGARWQATQLPLDELAGAEVRASFSLAVGGELPGFALIAEARLVRPRPAPPTVLLVTSDTHRADHVGAARDAVPVRTPALDELAARGVLFERAFSTSNITIPSHVALLTGLHPRDTRVVDNMTGVTRAASTLAEAFHERGWRTFAALSTHHLGDELSGLGQGFERMSTPPGSERPAAETCAIARSWLDDARGEPLFLWVHLFDAHGPYTPPEPLAAEYLGRDDPTLGTARLRGPRARYRGEITALDAELGKLFAEPRLREAIVALTADHGECLGEHGLCWEHVELYPDTVHVPLVLAWPGAPAGARVERTLSHAHLGRTLLDLAGLDDVPFPGESLVAQLTGDAPESPVFALAFAGESASITHGGWHLILHLIEHRAGTLERSRVRARHEVELYHLDADPACRRDLAADETARARGLRGALVAWLARGSPSGLATSDSADAATRAHLAGLGYADSEGDVDGAWFEADDCEWCARFE